MKRAAPRQTMRTGRDYVLVIRPDSLIARLHGILSVYVEHRIVIPDVSSDLPMQF